MTEEEMELTESISRNINNISRAYSEETPDGGTSDANLKLMRNAAQFILNDIADILGARA